MLRAVGKNAVITGAGSGIGRAIATRLAAEGAAVVVADIDSEGGQAAVDQITSAGGRARFTLLDTTSEQNWATLVDEIDRIDVLVNNAGIYLVRPLTEITVQDWDKVMSVNAKGVFLGMRAVAPKMAAADGGSIVNLSSTTGLTGIAGRTAYGASKGAVRIMTKDVAMEYASFQVRVNSVHPGFVKTQMAEQGARLAGMSLDELGYSQVPLGRLGEVEDVAAAVAFLASDEAQYITGAELVVDGGATAGQLHRVGANLSTSDTGTQNS
ncbi:SDR family NAD(P)-dependent oxidoreductase [Mycobacterium sp. NPDC003323]